MQLNPTTRLIAPCPPLSCPSAASNVKLVDSKTPEGFTPLEGKTEAAFAKIDVGSKAEHTYSLNVVGAVDMQAFEPAVVTYTADADGEEQVRAAGAGAARGRAAGQRVRRLRDAAVRRAAGGSRSPFSAASCVATSTRGRAAACAACVANKLPRGYRRWQQRAPTRARVRGPGLETAALTPATCLTPKTCRSLPSPPLPTSRS